jgi:hypothetical protein
MLTYKIILLPFLSMSQCLAIPIATKSTTADSLLTPTAYFWISLHYSLVSLAFAVRFKRKFGSGGFVLYWMADWVAMTALGYVMETVFLWLGPFFPFFLLFWVIINVSPCTRCLSTSGRPLEAENHRVND